MKTKHRTHGGGAGSSSEWLDTPITMRALLTKDFRVCVRTLKKLSSSERFSQNFLRRLRSLLLDGLELTAGNRKACAARRASMTLGISTSDDNLKLFSALAAFDLFLDRKVPSHNRILCLPNI
jgi:hypothetical protein